MCLLTFAYDTHPDYGLVFAGNRDEFYERPTAPASFWSDEPHVLAGRDLKKGGTWLGITRSGHWGVVTNIRSPDQYRPEARSRGRLVADYLTDEPDPLPYLTEIANEADRYNPFNLLVGTPDTLYYYSTREGEVEPVSPGMHGLSNAHLDSSWPKVEAGKRRLRDHLDGGSVESEGLLEMLDDRDPFPDEELPDTGVGQDAERHLSPLFIEGDEYGTRSSTVLLIGRSGDITFVERTFERGRSGSTRRFSFRATAPKAQSQ